MNLFLGIYLAGVAIGLAAIDARWPARVGLALVWPVGPLAFVVTISILVAASFIAFPLVGAVILAIVLAAALLAYALT